MTIRRATSDDVQRLLELEGLLFDNSLAETMLVRELELGEGLVYEARDGVLGYALIRSDGDKLDLTRLGVAPGSQGLGIGQELLQEVLSVGRTVILTVRKKNYGAIRFYRRHGFEIIGQLHTHDAWAMRRASASAPAAAPSDDGGS